MVLGWLRRQLRHQTPPAVATGSGGNGNGEQARKARQASEGRLEEARRQSDSVRDIVEANRALQRRNHFGEDIMRALGGPA